MSEPIILHNYVGDEFIAPSTGQYLDNHEPAVGTILSHVPKSNTEDVKAAVDAAKAAFNDWSVRSYQERADWLDKIANRLEERLDELALMESRDTGKPIKLAQSIDVPRSIAN